MKKVLSFLGIRRYSLLEVIILMLLSFATVLLSLKFIIKFDSGADICLHFVPIFILGALFGPLISSLASLGAYIISTLYFGTEDILIVLCITALLSGFVYGWLFYNKCELSKAFFKRTGLCIVIQFVLYVFVDTAIMSLFDKAKDFNDLYSLRMISGIVELFMQTAFIMLAPKYIGAFLELINKNKETD